MSFVGGKLKLKGDTGIVKKKKKKSTHVAVPSGDASTTVAPAEAKQDAAQVDADKHQIDEGSAPPAAGANQIEDRRTEAEKRRDAQLRKIEEARARKAATKSHRERIKELNEKLATLTEHHDIPRISYTV